MKTMTLFILTIVTGLQTVRVCAQWQQTGGPAAVDITALASKNSCIFAGTFDAGVFLTSDGGAIWSAVNTGLPDHHICTLQVNDTDIFAGHWAGLSRSTDNGSSWASAGLNSIVSCMARIGSILLAGGGMYLWRSVDYGQNWVPFNVGHYIDEAQALAADSSCAYVSVMWDGGMGTLNYLLERSPDSGLSWTYSGIDIGGYNHAPCTFLVNGSDVFAAVEGVYWSPDKGITWMQRNAGLTDLDVRSFAAAGTFIFAGTNSGGVFFSSDNGANWTPMNAGLTDLSVHSLAVSTTDLYAGTANSGVWKFPLSQVSARGIDMNRYIRVFPNPATDRLNIVTGSNGKSSAEIYDLQGQLITSFAFSGNHQTDLGSLKRGAYMIRIFTNEVAASRRFFKW